MIDLKPITVEDYAALKPYFTHQRYRLCPYHLNAVIAWANDVYHPEGAVHEQMLVIAAEFNVRQEHRHMILPVSPHKECEPLQLRDVMQATGYDTCWFVPEDYVNRHEKDVMRLFKVDEQSAYMDYIYRQSDLAHLKGNRYAKKRNLIHQFEGEYVDAGRIATTFITPSDIDACIAFLEEWCEERKCDDGGDLDLACEKQAILNTFACFSQFDVSGLMIRVDGKVSGFAVASQLTDDMGVLQFEKAFSEIKGLYQYFDRECARRLFGDYDYINKESDMDIPGLARAKRSYHPCMRIKSFKLSIVP